MDTILRIHDLHKDYEKHAVLKGIGFTQEAGTMLALLGPNGAGKSTIIDIISTLQSFEKGDVEVCGLVRSKQDHRIRKTIGIVFQDSVLDARLTIIENLRIRAKLYQDKPHRGKLKALLCECGLQGLEHHRVGTLSGGERRKADIARALLSSPKLLILDEPTTGLDPLARQQIWDLIFKLRNRHKISILLTTHYMEEAEAAERLVIMNHGELVLDGTPADLKRQSAQSKLILYPVDASSLCKKLTMQRIGYDQKSNNIVVPLSDSFQAITLINMVRMYVQRYEVRENTLEEAYLDLLGGEATCDSSY